MTRIVGLIVAGLLWAGPVAAQTNPNEVAVGEIVQLAFDPNPAFLNPQTGLATVYQVYVDGVALNPVVGPLAGSPGSMVVALPAFATAGDRVLTVSTKYAVTDPKLWKCPAAGCTEYISAPITVSVVPPDVPGEQPPTNLRIIRTTTVTDTTIDGTGAVVGVSSSSVTVVLPGGGS